MNGKTISFFFNLLKGTMKENYGRKIIVSWACRDLTNSGEKIRVLDVGLGKGNDVLNIRAALKEKEALLFGVECYGPNITAARVAGITVFDIDIEHGSIPVEDGFFDVVICNQTAEHLKEIFWAFSEMHRVLKKGGALIVGVPNLAALHNRFLLSIGEQPTCVETLGPHVRGFTNPSFKRFITCDGFFQITDFKGANFYPFPSKISKVLSWLFPTFSVILFFRMKKTDKPGRFTEVLEKRFFETPFYKGTENSKRD